MQQPITDEIRLPRRVRPLSLPAPETASGAARRRRRTVENVLFTLLLAGLLGVGVLELRQAHHERHPNAAACQSGAR